MSNACVVTETELVEDHVTGILDPDDRTIEEYVLEGGTYRQGALLDRPDDVFRPAAFPDLAIALKEIWE